MTDERISAQGTYFLSMALEHIRYCLPCYQRNHDRILPAGPENEHASAALVLSFVCIECHLSMVLARRLLGWSPGPKGLGLSKEELRKLLGDNVRNRLEKVLSPSYSNLRTAIIESAHCRNTIAHGHIHTEIRDNISGKYSVHQTFPNLLKNPPDDIKLVTRNNVPQTEFLEMAVVPTLIHMVDAIKVITVTLCLFEALEASLSTPGTDKEEESDWLSAAKPKPASAASIGALSHTDSMEGYFEQQGVDSPSTPNEYHRFLLSLLRPNDSNTIISLRDKLLQQSA